MSGTIEHPWLALLITGGIGAAITGLFGVLGRIQARRQEPNNIDAFQKLNTAQAAEIARLEAQVERERARADAAEGRKEGDGS